MSKENEEKLNVTIKSNTTDLFAFTKLLPNRKKRIETFKLSIDISKEGTLSGSS